jgi:two-component system response regulator CpxR
VDDNVDLVNAVREYLVCEGFAVEAAYTYSSGLAAALSGKNSVVVLDVMLPGGSGFDLLRELRASSSVPVVMLSARGESSDRVTGLENGADDYIAKPFNPAELVARIRAVVRRTRSEENHSDAGDWISRGGVQCP